MPFEISKTFEFSAAHQLEHLPETHKCHRLHGHNYTVTVVLAESRLDVNGFIVDYAELDIVKKWLDENWDHRNLNEVIRPIRSTAEELARYLFVKFKDQFPALQSVTVSETPKTSATYRR